MRLSNLGITSPNLDDAVRYEASNPHSIRVFTQVMDRLSASLSRWPRDVFALLLVPGAIRRAAEQFDFHPVGGNVFAFRPTRSESRRPADCE